MNRKSIFEEFDWVFGPKELTDPIYGGGYDKTLFEKYKDDFEGNLERKPLKKAFFKTLDGKPKLMYFEDLYFRIEVGKKVSDYAIEIDQDFHKNGYVLFHEILRQAAYFEYSDQKSDMLVRFGYRDNLEGKKELDDIFETFLKNLKSSRDPNSLYENLKEIKDEWKEPLVIFVNYPTEEKFLNIHEKMNSQEKKMKKLIFAKYLNSSKVIKPENYSNRLKPIWAIHLSIFPYNRDRAEQVAGALRKNSLKQLFDKFRNQFDDSCLPDAIREDFSKTMNKFSKDFEDLVLNKLH